MSPEDLQSSRLSYPLLRLSLLGLTERDREQLLELARFAFQELDVSEAVHRIRDTESASPLAVAIASIVLHAQPSKKMAMLGAVFGAYTGLFDPGGGTLKGVIGAMAGAVAMSTSEFIRNDLAVSSWWESVHRSQ
jgi:hypothetical protein